LPAVQAVAYLRPGLWERQIVSVPRSSPLSLVGNVTTPTALLTGEVDYRTPLGQSEQFYQALKIRKVDNILAWFSKYAK